MTELQRRCVTSSTDMIENANFDSHDTYSSTTVRDYDHKFSHWSQVICKMATVTGSLLIDTKPAYAAPPAEFKPHKTKSYWKLSHHTGS